MNHNLQLRFYKEGDEERLLQIYTPYVTHSSVSFEYEIPSLEEWTQRIRSIAEEFPFIVCTDNDEVVGYAYAGKHRSRKAYSWSCECTVYLDAKHHGQRIGRVLYQCLFDLLRLQGYYNVYAAVTVPNPRSESFHLACGFSEIGYFTKTGYKFGRWHDTRWFQLHLAEHHTGPAPVVSFSNLQHSTTAQDILLRHLPT